MPRRSPKPEDIAEFHSLLREAETLARQTSQPFVGLIWGPFLEMLAGESALQLIEENVDAPLINFLTQNSEAEKETIDFIVNLLTTLIVVPGVIYILYQVWQLLMSATLYFFPSGTATTQQHLFARTLEHQLKSAEELDIALIELRAHIQNLRQKNNLYLLLSFAFVVSFNAFLEKIYKTNLDNISEHYFGTPHFIGNTVQVPLLLLPFQYTLNKLNNRNPETIIAKHKQQLEKFTLIKLWEQKKYGGVNSTVFFIRVHPKENVKINISGLKINISYRDYIAELFRLCIENKIPVYTTGSGNIYIGFTALSSNKVNVLSKVFSERLLQKELFQRTMAIFAANDIIPKINYIYASEETLTQKSFRFEIFKPSNTSKNLARAIKLLIKTYGAEAVADKNDFIYIACDKNNPMADYGNIQNYLHTSHTYISTYSLIPEQLSKRNIKVTAKPISKPETVKDHILNIPAEIKWPRCKARFLRDETTHFAGKAYCLHDPEEKEGTIFATIDERIFAQAQPYLEGDAKKQILAIIDRGVVFQKGKIKTKKGNTGIADSDGLSYNDLAGKPHSYSKYKIKIGNLRIFCEPAKPHQVTTVDKENRVAYHFNGIGFGH